MSTTAALEVKGLTKRFGAFTAVRDLSFRVEPGRICGFIGPNGAGKTTTMRICATLELPDEGEVLVGGVSAIEDARGARHRLGFMPDAYGAYPATTVAEYLDFFARAYGLRGAQRRERLRFACEFTSLDGLLAKEMSALSKGMKQRLCLAKTLLHDPELLILDEPAAGLDPRARVELRELVRSLAQLGKAVLVSSHILTELSELCDEVVILERGVLRAAGSVREILASLRRARAHHVRALAAPEDLRRALLEWPGLDELRPEGDGFVFTLAHGVDDAAELLAALVQRGLRPVEFSPRESNLEDLFLALTEGQVQ
ncbi:MAG: ABC transporter ATP-binding protein [Planctomycetes bacterium]|nr:ABC transporter ATP-binding protein [Planctomycetota bacterium]